MDEERYLILKMLEEGKVTAEEASALLEALDAEGGGGGPEARGGDSGESPGEPGPPSGRAGRERPRPERRAHRRCGRDRDDLTGTMEDLRHHLERIRLGVADVGDEVSRRFQDAMRSPRAVEWRRGGPRPLRRFIRSLGDAFSLPFGRERHEEKIEKELSISPDGHVEIRAISGDVAVKAGDEALIHVEATKRVWAATREEAVDRASDYRIYLEPDGTGARLGADLAPDAPGWLPARCTIDYKVRVPAAAKVDVSLTNGDVEVVGVRGGADLRSMNGDIKARSVSGSIRLNSTNGDLVLQDARAEGLSLRSVNGDLSVGLAGLGPGEHGLHTVRGDVEVVVPETMRLNLLVSTMHGEIDLAAPGRVIKRSPSHLEARLEPRTATEAGEAPPPSLEVRTLFGNVLIKTGGQEEPPSQP